MPPPRHANPRSAGQASVEYAGLLALVAAALAAAGVAAGPGEIGQAVAGGIRTGICLLAGDVCRTADAEAAGLAPCTVTDRTRGAAGAITVVSLRFGERGEWTVASRSDGSVAVTRRHDRSAGVSGGLGVTASPLGIELGAEGTLEYTLAEGETWELPDTAAATRFLALDDGDRPPPTWRFGDLAEEARGEIGASAGGVGLVGVEASAEQAAGARLGRGETTLYVRAGLDGPRVTSLVGDGPSLGGTGDVLVELTRDAGGLREIAFRTVERGAAPDQVVETVARLDLRDPTHRAAAGPLLDQRLPWPPAIAAGLRTVARRAVQLGTVERAVYAVHDDSDDLAAAARLGLELGVELERIAVDRRLVAASAWTPGSGERERVDCLGGA
jgi:Flp pilus assembly pilin Flp